MNLQITQIENRLRAKLATQAINEPDFRELLRAAAIKLKVEAERAENEATVEAAFERHLFALLRAIGIDYAPVKEGVVTGTVLRQTGRTDSRFQNVVIEFKSKSELVTAKQVQTHLEQLKDYLRAISNSSEGEQIGFLTDGKRYVQCVLTAEGVFNISGALPVDADCLFVICRALLAAKRSALTAENLVKDFSGEIESGHIFVAARALLSTVVNNSTLKTEMLRSEWESLFRLAHEDTSQQKRIELRREALGNIFRFKISDSSLEYLCLFSLHTAYSIVVKLVAYKVVSDTMFGMALQDFKSLLTADDASIRSFCSALEDGELFRQVGILNLLEGDFFSWYADQHQWNDKIAECVRDTLNVLSQYEDARNIFAAKKAVDLFRHLYEAAIPQVVRASFGEFYTPLWLAQHVLKSSGFTLGERVLDPCCGSGTFLIASLQFIREAGQHLDKKELLEVLLSSVAGIDLNPLAVLTARIHFFIYISDLVDRSDQRLIIPIFLGDASNVPTITGSGRTARITYQLRTLKTPLEIELPARFVNDAKTLFEIMNSFESLVAQKDYQAARKIFSDYCQKEKFSKDDEQCLFSLADQIIELEKKEWNGIWARVVANFASTIAIGRFDHIIGNPPWIDWKTLPAGYRETVKGLCIDRGLFSGAGRTGGINLNVCALITHVAATNWLKKGGTLAFLMPRELAVQASYEGWRKSVGGADCKIVRFHDWSDAGHPFEPVREDFMTYVLKSGPHRGRDVPCTTYTRAERGLKPWLWETLGQAERGLLIREEFARAIIPDSSAFTFAKSKNELDEYALIAGKSDYIGREGIEFYPQELVMFRFLKPGKKDGTVFVENFQGVKSKFKLPRQTLLLETKYLFPLVKGPYISRFEYKENDLLVAFPYEEADPFRPISRAQLRRNSPHLLSYFLKYERQFEAQTAYSDSIRAAGEFYGFARTGPYSFAHTYVAFRDNTKWEACVVKDKEMPWGEKRRYLFQNHAVSMCENGDREFIGEGEAHYIAAILNADVTARFIRATSDDRSFKIRPPIYIPRFDPADSIHKRLALISKAAHKNPAMADGAVLEASRLYLEVCKRRKMA